MSEHRAATQLGNVVHLHAHVAEHRAVQAGAGLGDAGGFLRNIGHNALTRIGGGGGAQVGDRIEDGGVCLVTDCRDHRGGGRRDGADERLLRKGQQVFEGSAASGDDDDVHFRVGVQFGESRNDLSRRTLTLNAGIAHLEDHAGPAQGGVADNVLLRVRIATGNQTHTIRQHGQRLLPRVREQPLGGESFTQTLQLLVQVTGADRVHFLADEGELAVLPQARLGAGDDASAYGHIGRQAATGTPEEREGEGEVFVEVFELHEDVAAAAVEGGDLRLHPELGNLVYVVFEVLREQGEGPGVGGGGFLRLPGKLPLMHGRHHQCGCRLRCGGVVEVHAFYCP